MINKQNLWFLTLFSLILVLSVYYITMPSSILTSQKENTKTTTASQEKTTEVIEASSLNAMRVSLEEEREEEIATLQEQLTSEEVSSEEKNSAYEKLKYLNELQGKEETFEKKIKEKYKLDCFVKIDNSNVQAICISTKHDNVLANNIMRLIQENYKEKMYITVKFQKS